MRARVSSSLTICTSCFLSIFACAWCGSASSSESSCASDRCTLAKPAELAEPATTLQLRMSERAFCSTASTRTEASRRSSSMRVLWKPLPVCVARRRSLVRSAGSMLERSTSLSPMSTDSMKSESLGLEPNLTPLPPPLFFICFCHLAITRSAVGSPLFSPLVVGPDGLRGPTASSRSDAAVDGGASDGASPASDSAASAEKSPSASDGTLESSPFPLRSAPPPSLLAVLLLLLLSVLPCTWSGGGGRGAAATSSMSRSREIAPLRAMAAGPSGLPRVASAASPSAAILAAHEFLGLAAAAAGVAPSDASGAATAGRVITGLSGSLVRHSSGSLHTGRAVSGTCPAGGPTGPIFTRAAAIPFAVLRTSGSSINFRRTGAFCCAGVAAAEPSFPPPAALAGGELFDGVAPTSFLFFFLGEHPFRCLAASASIAAAAAAASASAAACKAARLASSSGVSGFARAHSAVVCFHTSVASLPSFAIGATLDSPVCRSSAAAAAEAEDEEAAAAAAAAAASACLEL